MFQNNSPCRKIAIVGCAGSGKTTLAFKLKEKLNIPAYHLDDYHWLPGWKRVDFYSFDAAHDALCDLEEWIIEGSYIRNFPYRAIKADVIIFLDVPRYKCIWHVVKRAIIHHGKVLPGSPPGCKQRLWGSEFIEFLQWIWHFNRRFRRLILSILDELKDCKQIYIVKSYKELKDL